MGRRDFESRIVYSFFIRKSVPPIPYDENRLAAAFRNSAGLLHAPLSGIGLAAAGIRRQRRAFPRILVLVCGRPSPRPRPRDGCFPNEGRPKRKPQRMVGTARMRLTGYNAVSHRIPKMRRRAPR
jgi:hypothetical protein